MTKQTETLLWTLCVVMILTFSLSDPWILGWITENWDYLLISAVCVALTAVISGCHYHREGYAKGCAAGYTLRVNEERGLIGENY